jgi:hypothetical protein
MAKTLHDPAAFRAATGLTCVGYGWAPILHSALSSWAQNHEQTSALHHGAFFHLRHIRQIASEALEQLSGDLRMGNLPASESNPNLDLRILLKESPSRTHLECDVVLPCLGAQANLPDLSTLP